MKRTPGGGRLSVAEPQFYPKTDSCLDLPGLLSIIATRPSQKFYIQVDLKTPFCLCDYRMPDVPIVYTSTSFEKLTGYSEEESLGRNCRFLQGEATDPLVAKRIGESIRNGTEETFELVNYKKDGSKFINYLTMLPIFDNEHDLNPIYSLGVQSEVPFARVGLPLNPAFAVARLEVSITTGPESLRESDVMDDDQRSMFSGFTGFVEDSSPGSSIKLFGPASSVGEDNEADVDGSTNAMDSAGTFLNEEEREGKVTSNTSSVSKKDSGFAQSNYSSLPMAHLEKIHRKLGSIDICKAHLAKATKGRKQTGMKAQVLLMLEFLEGIVDATND